MRGPDENKIAIVEAGAAPPLISLLASTSLSLQAASAGALQTLSANGAPARSGMRQTRSVSSSDDRSVPPADDNKIAIAAAGAIPPLIALLALPSLNVQRSAAWALRNLAWNSEHAAAHVIDA